MLKKRGQITIFIFLGMIILAAFLFLIYLRFVTLPEFPKEKSITIAPAQAVKTYVEDCLKKTSNEEIKEIYKKGGFIEPQETIQCTLQSRNCLFEDYTLLLNNSNKFFITSDSFSNEISKAIEKKFNCDLSDFEEQGYIIEQTEPSIKTILRDQSTSIILNWNLKFTKGDLTFEQNNFIVELPFQFKRIFFKVPEIIGNETTSNNINDISNFITTLIQNENFQEIERQKLSLNNIDYVLYELNHSQDPYTFAFAIKK